MESVNTRSPGTAGTREVVFEVTGMTCGSCVARVENVLAGEDGVEGAVVDLASKRARVSLAAEASTDRLIEAVEGAGYHMSPL